MQPPDRWVEPSHKFVGPLEQTLSALPKSDERVKSLLSKLASVVRSEERNSKVSEEAVQLLGKFAQQLDRIFAALPKSIEWLSFYRHDLPLVTDLDSQVRGSELKTEALQLFHKFMEQLERILASLP